MDLTLFLYGKAILKRRNEMSENGFKIVERVLEILVLIIVLTFIYFAACRPAHANSNNKHRGDWICFVNSVNDESCGTIGWHKDKNLAFEAALNKCEDHCESNCKLEYCEKIK